MSKTSIPPTASKVFLHSSVSTLLSLPQRKRYVVSLPPPSPSSPKKKEREINYFLPKTRSSFLHWANLFFFGHYYSYQAEAVCIHGLNYDNQLAGVLGRQSIEKESTSASNECGEGRGGKGPPKTRKEETLLPFFIFFYFFLPDLFKRSSTWM